MARNPNRIFQVGHKLMEVWSHFPDMRLGQLLHNATGEDDMFYVEDDEMLGALENFLETHKENK